MTATGLPRHSPVARQLARINMAASASALLLAGIVLAAYDFITVRDTLVANRLVQAQIVGSNSTSALTFDDDRVATEILGALRAAPQIQAAALFRPDGALFASYQRDAGNPPAFPPLPPDADLWHQTDGLRALHVATRVQLENQTLGFVYIRSELGDLRGRLLAYTGILLVVAVMASLASQWVARVSMRSISQPLGELAELAGRLSAERDYSVRATATGHGEVGVLVSAFNDMLAQIQERDRSLRDSHDLLERRVEERTAALNASNRELEAFCYSVSHDLRSPLRSIDGFSQALLEDYADTLNDEATDYLGRIRAATQRMGTLIDDLLSLSRISRTQLTSKPVDLTAMARSVIDDCRTLSPDRQVDVVIAEGVTVNGDARLLRQVMDNLLGNAWKFSSRQPQARIEFGMTTGERGEPVYFVKDNGAGFDPAYAQRLFGVFQRLHAMTEFPGTGVGLAIVERIIQRHSGRVWADAAVGKGATFYFTIGALRNDGAPSGA